ncbi:MAG: glucose-6-phosphate isomerase [Chloroflexi bacterium]|nr:MAG: glucose-6-phosphate isomerase [Chloroflexota bacterium]
MVSMAALANPFVAILDGGDSLGDVATTMSVCRYSDLAGLVADEAALAVLVDDGDRAVYRVAKPASSQFGDELRFAVTTIESGVIGEELHMTKGHLHVLPRAEMYVGLEGLGGVLLSDFQRVRWLELRPRSIVTIPPGWAHRAVNVGHERLRFIAIYPQDAGTDYATVAARGLGARVVRHGDGYRVLGGDDLELT